MAPPWGGGQLNLTGATASGPAGVAIDQASGRIYSTNYNNGTISFANLDDSGGGGQLPTTGAPINHPWGLAIDPVAGRVYWANFKGGSLSFANLSGSGGGPLNVAPLAPGLPDFPSLLEPPLGTSGPSVSGGSTAGSTLRCSEGTYAPDLLESFLYRAPQSFAYSWTRNGAPISHATASSITARAAGSYACQVTATNHAGSAVQRSGSLTLALPLKVTTASLGNQKITLKTPSPVACVASPDKLTATVSSKRKSTGAKLKFSSVSFYIGKGIKHTRHKKKGGKKVVVVTYTPNATKHHAPANVQLSLAGLKSGTHSLKVVISYKEIKHSTTVTVTKTLKVTFVVC